MTVTLVVAFRAGRNAAICGEPMLSPLGWPPRACGWFEIGYLSNGEVQLGLELQAAAQRQQGREASRVS